MAVLCLSSRWSSPVLGTVGPSGVFVFPPFFPPFFHLLHFFLELPQRSHEGSSLFLPPHRGASFFFRGVPNFGFGGLPPPPFLLCGPRLFQQVFLGVISVPFFCGPGFLTVSNSFFIFFSFLAPWTSPRFSLFYVLSPLTFFLVKFYRVFTPD